MQENRDTSVLTKGIREEFRDCLKDDHSDDFIDELNPALTLTLTNKSKLHVYELMELPMRAKKLSFGGLNTLTQGNYITLLEVVDLVKTGLSHKLDAAHSNLFIPSTLKRQFTNKMKLEQSSASHRMDEVAG